MKFLMSVVSIVFVSMQAWSDVSVVENVDLKKYVGKWFEIASIPHSFQRQCVGNVTATYSQDSDSMIKVVNSCEKSDGTFSVSEGRAKVQDPNVLSKLKVTFVKLGTWLFMLGGDYWIIELDPEYQYAVVGHPSRDYGWILSRTPVMSEQVLYELSLRLKKQGYDLCRFQTTIQNGGASVRRNLCEIFKERI